MVRIAHAGLDWQAFLDEEDSFKRNFMIHVADEVLLRRQDDREDLAIRTINALGKQMK